MSGILFGVGVGPGDSDLVTLKAVKVMEDVGVIAYLEPSGGSSLARSIAAPHLSNPKQEIKIPMSMNVDPGPAQKIYDEYAEKIASSLEEGSNVAFLCEGDPFIYGSFMYIYERLSERFETKVVPGVSALAATAAAAGVPLVSRNDAMGIFPATLSQSDLEARLQKMDAAAIIKVGRHLGKVKRAVENSNRTDGAVYVESATTKDEKVCLLKDAGEEGAYFSMVLVRVPKKEVALTQSLPSGAAIVVLGESGLLRAEEIRELLPKSSIHGLEGRLPEARADELFSDTMAHLRELFLARTPIVGICAAGILVRAIAPVIGEKGRDPAVVAVAEDGSCAVPVLGGHLGANQMARSIADLSKGCAAITTAGDVRFGLALDDPPAGWTLANKRAAKKITASLLGGTPVALKIEAGDASWIRKSKAKFSDEGAVAIRVCDHKVADPGDDLIMHPPVLALGVGCERGVEPEELLALADKALGDLSRDSVAVVVSLDLKSDEEAVHKVAEAFGVPARFFSAEELEAETLRLAKPSDIVFRAVGCHGVSEGAALAAVGGEGALVVEKTGSCRTTCAIARSPRDIDPLSVGRARGRLAVVGIGPGVDDWRTPEATKILQNADDVVGYGPYLELAANVLKGAVLHSSKMTEEEKRVRKALDLASEGKNVALISSGDAGIYALASLVFELLEKEEKADWSSLDISVSPGVSAFQAAASRIGAPMGHDFCTISLSDLLTPWDDIEGKIKAAGDGDFIVAFYNPVSKRRQWQLPKARDILLESRSKDTPVVIARNVGRKDEAIKILSLGEMDESHADMLSVVLVGNTKTKEIEQGAKRWVYTPRGYANKTRAE
jgi:cobalt-precorrin 5A hydrolase / precorrin-3B C17-methyltransferase